MLRLSKLTDYGTVVMTYLAREPARMHNATEIAARIGVALPTVSKVLKLLAKNELVVSLRGAKGGYMLARPPAKISVAEIIDAMEGRIAMTECSSASGLCEQERGCSIRVNWMRINHAICTALEAVTLADMTQPVTVHRVNTERLHTSGARLA